MTELKPCPFCGGTPSMISVDTLEIYADSKDINEHIALEIRCRQCGASVKHEKAVSRFHIIEAWNNRVENWIDAK